MKSVQNSKSAARPLVGAYLLTLSWVVLFSVSLAYAPTGGPYELTWTTIDSGGATSSAGPYTLASTIGQPDAAYSAAGPYELLGGFWPGQPPCFVEFGDFARFADLWLAGDLTCDLDGNTKIDLADLDSFADYWLSNCPYPWPLK